MNYKTESPWPPQAAIKQPGLETDFRLIKKNSALFLDKPVRTNLIAPTDYGRPYMNKQLIQ